MNLRFLAVALIVVLSCELCHAQLNGFIPAETNQPGKQFPQVNAEGKVRVSISVPLATKVQLDISGKKYDLVKDDKGVWTGESLPQDEGFHYYQLIIDGAEIPDPGSRYFYGAGRLGSGIEIPAYDREFFALKQVPHGQVSENVYYSGITRSWRRCFVYTPPGYGSNTGRYPVLYLQHGSFEDETGWATQGKANLILDNLIAEKKAKPMIIVIENGYAFKPTENAASTTEAQRFPVFEDLLIREVIPMIDSNYRTIADRDHRAIAGLSMGANQTMRVLMNHLDKFSHYGGFSGTSNYPATTPVDPNTFLNGSFKDGPAINTKLKLLWLGLGTKEPPPFPGSIGAFRNMLNKQGIRYVFYESPETAHEWLTWRRCLNQFAPLLFK